MTDLFEIATELRGPGAAVCAELERMRDYLGGRLPKMVRLSQRQYHDLQGSLRGWRKRNRDRRPDGMQAKVFLEREVSDVRYRGSTIVPTGWSIPTQEQGALPGDDAA